MKKIFVLLLLTSSVFNSCVNQSKVVKQITRTYFKNSTSHLIKFLPYKNGSIITDNIKLLMPNSTTLLESNELSIPSISTSFGLTYQQVTDSILVTFDGIKKEKHQFPGFTEPYLPNKERCIETNDGGAYEIKIIEQRKNSIEVEFTYTFTEQDYVDAEPIN